MDVERDFLVVQNAFQSEVLVFKSLGSTNDYLKELVLVGAQEGTVVIAEQQTAGKGRLGRRWASPAGGAWFSVLLKPKIAPNRAGCIAILAAVALAQSLRNRWQISVGVKWPNDLYVRGRKLGGILIELSTCSDQIEWLIAGVGINVNNELPTNTRIVATSLARELGYEIPLQEFLSVALQALDLEYQRFLQHGFEPLRQRWSELSVLGKRIVFTPLSRAGEGEIAEVLGLSESGKLIVRTVEGLRELTGEEVTLKVCDEKGNNQVCLQ